MVNLILVFRAYFAFYSWRFELAKLTYDDFGVAIVIYRKMTLMAQGHVDKAISCKSVATGLGINLDKRAKIKCMYNVQWCMSLTGSAVTPSWFSFTAYIPIATLDVPTIVCPSEWYSTFCSC